MSEKSEPQVVIAAPTKSMGISIILTILFGPLGMLYSTIIGGIVMFVLMAIIGFVTAGIGLIVLWPICIIWAAVATNAHNKKLISGKKQY